MSLEFIQQQFKSYLLEEESEITTLITGDTQAFREHRLAIYGEAYINRLYDALYINFSSLYFYLGDDDFDKLALAYIKKYPSKNYCIRNYGEYMVAFLQSEPSYRNKPELAELAQLEWMITEATDAKDMMSLTMEGMAAIPPEEWEDLSFVLHPSVRWLRLTTNMMEINQALKLDKSVPELIHYQKPITLLVSRTGLKTHYQTLTPEEAWLIDHIQQGDTFGDLCQELSANLPEEEVAQLVATTLFRWIGQGLFARLVKQPA